MRGHRRQVKGWSEPPWHSPTPSLYELHIYDLQFPRSPASTLLDESNKSAIISCANHFCAPDKSPLCIDEPDHSNTRRSILEQTGNSLNINTVLRRIDLWPYKHRHHQ